jgi:hypothetical protein
MKSNEKCYPCHRHGFHLHHLSGKQPPLALWSWCCLGYLLVFCALLWCVHVPLHATMLPFPLLCCIMKSDKEHNVVILVSFILSK